jgi:hypothetical protein
VTTKAPTGSGSGTYKGTGTGTGQSAPPSGAANEVLSVSAAREALLNGSGPKKALENYLRAGNAETLMYVVRSVLHFWHKDTELWKEAAPNVEAALNDLDEEG